MHRGRRGFPTETTRVSTKVPPATGWDDPGGVAALREQFSFGISYPSAIAGSATTWLQLILSHHEPFGPAPSIAFRSVEPG
jgi:hypothetical protein